MTGHVIGQQNPQIQHELTPRDNAKKIVSEVLRRVDQMIRKGNLNCAQLEISKAKKLDPRNVYVLALEERISILKTEGDRLDDVQQPEDDVQTHKIDHIKESEMEVSIALPKLKSIPKVILPALIPDVAAPAPIPVVVAPAPVPLGTEPAAISAVAAPAKIPVVVPSAPISEAAVTKSIAVPPIATEIQPPNSYPAPVKSEEALQFVPNDRSCELNSYRKALVEAWEDGAITANEQRQLSELRALLEITDAEHEHFEKNIRSECYRSAMLLLLSNKTTSVSHAKSLAFLKRKFRISDDELEHIQTQLMNTMQQKKRDKVLVIDDDTSLLDLLAASLDYSGFDVTVLPTSDEAYTLLKKFIPDLILCDIHLETSTMGGFTFYEKVQELKNLQSVPFVFLTGLTDEALVRTSKELGVDDYLMKPISEQILVSTVRGKLKRFKQLKRLADVPAPALAMV